MFDNLSLKLEKAFQTLKGQGRITEINVAATIKEIKKTALGSVFLKEFEGLDEHSKEVIENILDYMEKKYISVPMKMAKAVLLDLPQKN